jgi:N utilization substance protein A
VAYLFAQEIPEIAAGGIEIRAIARKPGYRSKFALQSRDPRVDCIGACVGLRGARIKKIVDALGGERTAAKW